MASLKTDGLQVKVLLATVVKAEHSDETAVAEEDAPLPYCGVKYPLPRELLSCAEKGTR